MFCKWCGLESETSDICSWCRHPFTTSAKPANEESKQDAGAQTQPGEQSAAMPAAGSPSNQRGAPVELGEAFDDDLSPFPFLGGMSSSPIAPSPPAETAPPKPVAPPPITPPAQPIPRQEPPTASNWPSAPAAAEPQTVERPIDEAIQPQAPTPPVKESQTPANPPPIGLIPLKDFRKPAAPPAKPPAETTSKPAPVVPPIPIAIRKPGTTPPVVPLTEIPPISRPETPPPPIQEPVEAPPPVLKPPPSPPVSAIPMPKTDLPTANVGQAGSAPKTPTSPPPVPPRTVGPATTVVPRARTGGRTTLCRYCGLESETATVCSWCHKPLSLTGTVAEAPRSVVMTSHRTGNLTRHPVRKAPEVPQPKTAEAPSHNNVKSAAPVQDQHVPQMGAFQAVKSKYYSGMVYDPVSGTHYDADSGKTTDTSTIALDFDEPDIRAQIVKYIPALIGIILVAIIATKAAPGFYLGTLFLANFGAAILLPLMKVAPFADDDSDDLALAIGLFLIAGPFVGAILYGIVVVMRQDGNPAIGALFVLYLLIRIPMDIAMGSFTFTAMMPFAKFTVSAFAANWMTLAGLAGWYCASFFHKLDE